MNHSDFFRLCSDRSISGCFLLEGEEEFVKHSAAQTLRNTLSQCEFPEMNTVVMNDPSADEIIAACETLPFMADRRLVMVRDCSMLSAAEKTRDYDTDEHADRLKEYLPELPSSTCLVFYIRGKADRRKKLFTAIGKRGTVVSFEPLSENDLNKWIEKRCRMNGKTADGDTCRLLWFTCGKDLTLLANEIDKLCDHAGDSERILPEDIERMCTRTVEFKVFDLADQLLSGNGKKAFETLRLLVADGEQRVMLISLLGRQCRNMLYVRGCRDARQAASMLGIPFSAAAGMMQQIRFYTAYQTEEMCRLCTETEYNIKNGSLIEEGALENIMLRILAMREENRTGGEKKA